MARIATLLGSLLALALIVAPATRADTVPDAAAGARQDAGRTGFLGGGTLGRPPLTRRWTTSLGNFASAPLIAGSRVYVSHRPIGASNSRITAFDAVTGTQVWVHTVAGDAQIAYGDGLVVAKTSSGAVLALDAADGTTRWVTETASKTSGEVVIDGGLVFIGSKNDYNPAASVLRLSDGSVAWTKPSPPAGPVAVAGGLALFGDECSTQAWVAATGARAFSHPTACGYGYNGSVASSGGHVVTRESSGRVLDISGGNVRDAVGLTGDPALAGDVLVTPDSGYLEARSLTTGVTLWSSPPPASMGSTTSPATIVDGVVYAARASGALQALDLDTGAALWSDALDTSGGFDANAVRIAAGSGTLAVVNGDELIVYGGAASTGAGLRVTAGPEGPTQSASAAFAFTPAAAPATHQCRLDNAAWTACAGSASYAGLADRPHVFSVRALAGGTVVGLAQRGFSVDRTAPVTTITGGPEGTLRYPYASFSFTVAGGGTSECRLDGSAWSPCEGSFSHDGSLADGDHVFAVRSSDPAGNVESPPKERRFTVDASPPAVFIESQPASATKDRTARVEFHVTDAATVTCAWDGEPAAPCSSPAVRDDLSDGNHTFMLAAADPIGNTTYRDVYWSVDTRAPRTEILDGPSGTIATDQASVTFHADNDAFYTNFECRLDDQPWTACGSPWVAYGMTNGAHRIQVRAIDFVGNLESPPAERSFTVAGTGTPSQPQYQDQYQYQYQPYSTPTPSPTATPLPTAVPQGAGTSALSNPKAPPGGYQVLMPAENRLVASPAALLDELRAYLRERRARTVARSLRVTVPYVPSVAGKLELRLMVAGRTAARSSTAVTPGTLAWPRLAISSKRAAIVRRSRGGTLRVTFAGRTTKARLRWHP